jgi:hypothetical protein
MKSFLSGEKMSTWFWVVLSVFLTQFLPAKIAVVTVAIGEKFQKIVEIPIKNKKEYCLKYGYDLIVGEEKLNNRAFIPWEKITILQKLMETSGYEWFFWSDADAMFMNFSIPLEKFIDDEAFLIISKDYHGLNNGHFLIKNCIESKQFLQNVWDKVSCLKRNNQEQDAMAIEIEENENCRRGVKFIPQRMFNSFPIESFHDFNVHFEKGLYQPKDFIIHIAGLQDPQFLKDKFSYYQDKISYESIDFPYFVSFFGKTAPFEKNRFRPLLEKGEYKNFVQKNAPFFQDAEEIYFFEQDAGLLAIAIQPFLKEKSRLFLKDFKKFGIILKEYSKFQNWSQKIEHRLFWQDKHSTQSSSCKKMFVFLDPKSLMRNFQRAQNFASNQGRFLCLVENKEDVLESFFAAQNIVFKKITQGGVSYFLIG